MNLVENDATKFTARPAVIIAGVRTGGTFLAHCLSNHPDIFCDRGESLHHGSVWSTNLGADPVKLLHCLTHMQGYRASLCKLIYSQAFAPNIWSYLVETFPRVIWLTRDNTIRQAVSEMMVQMGRRGEIARPAHSLEPVAPLRVELSAESILASARNLVAADELAGGKLEKMRSVLPLTYEQITRGQYRLSEEVGKEVCDFLGVRYVPMACELRRINAQPLSEMLLNWNDASPILRTSEFFACLEGE
jgi:hypothetical protein